MSETISKRKLRKAPESDPENSWLQVPAHYCDTFSTSIIRECKMVRIVFGDYVGREYRPFYRSAVVMPLSDIKSLIRHLSRLVAELEREEVQDESEPTLE